MSNRATQNQPRNNSSCRTTPSNNNTSSNNIHKQNNKESLLFNDVYGKEFSSKANNSNTSSEPKNDSINNFDISSIINGFFQNNSSGNNSEDSGIPDIETLLKFKNIFEHLNSKSSEKDPLVNLLYAIKPFIHDSKKSMIDQLAKFMTISYVLQDFKTFL